MHRHNLDLIAEYAEGSSHDDAAARALVASCDVCAAEFEAQRSAIAAMESLGPLTLSEHEKARLHRDTWTALRTTPIDARPARRSWPAWAAGAAAAALLVTVGLSGVLGQLDSGDAVTETFAEIGSALDGGGGHGRVNEEFADTTSVPAAGAPGADDSYFYDQGLDFASVAKAVLDNESRTTAESISDQEENCLVESGLVGYRLVEGTETLTRLLVGVPVDPESDQTVAFIDPVTCEVIHLEN